MRIFRFFLWALVAGLISSCGSQHETQEFDLLITNAIIVDVFSGDTIPSQLLGITDEVIRIVDSQENAHLYTGKNVLDAAGLYLMPGLWDMHVHFRGGDSLITENQALLPLFLQYGITSVRDAGGDMTPSVLDWRNRIKMGSLNGPTIFTSGPKLDGPRESWPGSIPLDSVSQVSAAIDSLEALGADYVKTYAGSLTADVYYEIIRESQARDLPVTGHMPFSASIYRAIAFGLDGTEHMYWVMKGAAANEDSLSQLPVGMVTRSLVPSFDARKADSLYRIMARNKVTVTPTLHITNTLGGLVETDHSGDTLLNRMGAGIRETYKRRIEGAERAGEEGARQRKALLQLGMDMIVPMYKAGVPLLAGSDSGPYNSFVYPGSSLHGELMLMVEAGLTAREAIEASVINGPAFFGQQKYYGSLEAGKFADILILRANPMRDIRNLRAIEMVLHKGKLYSRDSLDALTP